MGLLDKNITITFLEGKVSLEDLFELLLELVMLKIAFL